VEFLLEFNSIAGTFCEDRVKITVCDIDLTEVSFHGVGKYNLHRDTDGMFYSNPHWQDNSTPPDGDADDNGDRMYPVSYVRGSTMRAVARLVVAPTDAFGPDARIRGDGPEGMDFEGDTTLSGGVLSMNNTPAGEALENAVGIFDPMEIIWSVSPDGGTTWLCGEISRNPVYVVLDTPALSFPERRYHTLFRNSCRDAEGATTQDEVLSGVWSDFTDRVVMRADDPVQLTYYANWVCGNLNTQALLATGDGQCGAWATLLLDMLRAHGINHTDEFVTIRYNNPDFPNTSDRGFFIKEWTFAPGGGISGHQQLTYLNLPPEGADGPFSVNNAYVWRFSEVNDSPGIPGQGTPNPKSSFNLHQMVRINGVYYDPSYGKSYNSLAEFDDHAVAAHFVRSPDPWPVNEMQVNLDLNGNGQIEDVIVNITPPDDRVILIQANPPGNQLEESISDY
jgi:hypothetical protein